MDKLGIDIDQIVELDTQIGCNGAMRSGEAGPDSTWEQIIAVVMSIREPDPS